MISVPKTPTKPITIRVGGMKLLYTLKKSKVHNLFNLENNPISFIYISIILYYFDINAILVEIDQLICYKYYIFVFNIFS